MNVGQVLNVYGVTFRNAESVLELGRGNDYITL